MRFVYGIGNLSYGVISQTIANYFMFFGTSVLKIPGTLVGVAIAISTLWDGLTDTIFGYVSDNYNFLKMGKRNGYMLVATIGMAITNMFIWIIPINISIAGKFIWSIVSLILIETFNTMFSTPYTALGNDISCNYHEKTLLQTFKTVFFIIGIVVPVLLLYIFLPNTAEFPIGQLNPNGYKKIAIVTSCICLIAGVICSFGTMQHSKSKTINDSKKKKWNIKLMFKEFFLCFKNKEQRSIIMGAGMSMIATTILTSVGLHVFTYCFFYSSTEITILLATLLLGTMVSQPLWFYISKKYDKKPALLTSIFLLIFGMFAIMIIYIFRISLYQYSFYIILLCIFICGIGSGALYTLPFSMYGDVIDKLNKKNKENKSATYSGTLTFANNMLNAIALFVVGILLDLIKFNSNELTQTLSVQTGLSIILFVGILAPLLLSVIIFSNHKIKNKDN